MDTDRQAVFVFDIEDILVNTIEPSGNSIVQRESTSIEVIQKAVDSVRWIIELCRERRIHPLFVIYTLEKNLHDINTKISLFSSRIPGFSFTKILHPTTAVDPSKSYMGILHLYRKVYRVSPSCPIFVFDTDPVQLNLIKKGADTLYPLYALSITDAGFDEGQSWNVALEKIQEVLPSYVPPKAPEPLASGSLAGASYPYNLSPLLTRIPISPIPNPNGGQRKSGRRTKGRFKKIRKTRRYKARGKK
jgi:hypothetical protein